MKSHLVIRCFCSHRPAQQISSADVGNGRGELKSLLDWMMPLFNTNGRRDKVRCSDGKKHK